MPPDALMRAEFLGLLDFSVRPSERPSRAMPILLRFVRHGGGHDAGLIPGLKAVERTWDSVICSTIPQNRVPLSCDQARRPGKSAITSSAVSIYDRRQWKATHEPDIVHTLGSAKQSHIMM